MRRSLFFVILLLCCAASGAALDVPNLKAPVTDLAGILTGEQSQGLEAKLRDLERTDSTQLAVLIIPSLEGESLEDYSERVATAWRLGQKGRDNGALLLIAMKERKVRIEAGYGLEPTLTDAKSNQIIQNEIAPHFRRQAYFDGIDAGVTAIVQVVRGLYQPVNPVNPVSPRPARSTTPVVGKLLEWAFFLFVPFLWLASVAGRLIGILGAGMGILLALSVFGPGLVAVLLGGLAGGLLGMLLGAMMGGANRTGRTRPWYYGTGGFSGHSGGSGFSSGDFSGGGFSGGGGSFGGGGSSGSW